MAALLFEWDEEKNRANRRKHRVSFEEARTAFLDENARLIADPDYSDDEDRFILLGLSIRLRLLVISHCYRESFGAVRIISARRADPSERREYARWLK
jgi:uncharacterized DUF497 family protein